MAIVQIQGEKEKAKGIYYEFDDASLPLGEGGMGKVFRGIRKNIHTNEVREVAIKCMKTGLPPNVIQRAMNEAAITLKNDNLVEMMGFVSVESKTLMGTLTVSYYVVSELLIGVSLSDLLKGDVKDQDGNVIPYAEELYSLYNSDRDSFAVTVMRKILSGILALHDVGYIHRDIDPSNIMITRNRKIKIIDFGIAKKVEGLDTDDRNLTVSGQFMGKPQYAAPELVLGDLKNQNRPTDIYALGILFYQLLTGKLPFEGPSHIVLHGHIHSKMPLRDIKNRRLREIIKKATEKDCLKRYNSAAEFRADLDNWNKQTVPWYKNKGFGIGIGLAVTVALVVIVIKIIPRPSQDDPIIKRLTAYEMLHVPDSAAEGLIMLKEMSYGGDVEATYLLSRLYAQSYKTYTLSDSIIQMKRNLGSEFKPDIKKSHEMLLEVVNKNPSDYRALYDLACDHYNYSDDEGISRDLAKCKQLLDQALKYAKEKGDESYIDKINRMLDYF